MKRSINVYWGWENWSQWFTLREFSTYPPLRLITHLKKNYSNSLVFKEYFKCPAFTQYHKNTFVIKSDLSINFGFVIF